MLCLEIADEKFKEAILLEDFALILPQSRENQSAYPFLGALVNGSENFDV